MNFEGWIKYEFIFKLIRGYFVYYILDVYVFFLVYGIVIL